MFAPSPKSSSSRRNKPYNRKAQPMSRSSSILGTIKNIVVAPLSWFVSNENFEDLGKRRRTDLSVVPGDGDESVGQKAKRMRVDSPERVQQATEGYLDPPSTSLQPTQPNVQWRSASTHRNESDESAYTRQAFTYNVPPLSDSRTMSIDPPSQYTYHHPAMVPLPLMSPAEPSHSMSFGPRDGSIQPPPSTFRLRTSLTPQPSTPKSLRREVSAPPPLSSLKSRPIFVKPPPEERPSRQLSAQKTLSLGTLAEFNRTTRSSSRDRMLASCGSIHSIPSQLATTTSPNALLQAMQGAAEKAFNGLQVYKTPIIPSRYRNAKVIPEFLKPKRVHVPIPMPKKDRAVKPSLGMSAKSNGEGRDNEKKEERERDDGKPYAGKGGLSKLLARRKAEKEEEERERTNSDVSNDEEMDVGIGKRDVGVSARMTSGSEDESVRARKKELVVDVDTFPAYSLADPFVKPPVALAQGGRSQPYGRVGRTRTRDPGLRSVPLGRTTNKFSAAFDDAEGLEGENEVMDTIDEGDYGDKTAPASNEKEVEPKKAAYEVPKEFTFANSATPIQHDHAGAKEPPITSLPFSLGKLSAATETTLNPAETPSSSKPPAFTFTASQPGHAAQAKETPAPAPPKLSVIPPTPEQSSEKKDSSTPSGFSAPPAASSAPAPTPSLSASGIPNFFVNSALLNGNKSSAAPSPTSSLPVSAAAARASPTSVPIKDPENPLWNGDTGLNAPSSASTPSVEPTRPAEPKPLSGDGESKPFLWGAKPVETTNASIVTPSPTPSPLFGASSKSEKSVENRQASTPQSGALATSAPGAPSSFTLSGSGAAAQPADSSHFAPASKPSTTKSAEPESKSAGVAPSSFFSFGASNIAPKPLFGPGATTNAAEPFSSAASQPAQGMAGSTEQKSAFTFGTTAPAASATSNASTNAPAAPKPLFGGTNGSGFSFGASTAPAAAASSSDSGKSPFAFGAPPATPPSGGAEPKSSTFAFGAPAPAPSTGATGFSFGAPAKTNETAAEAPASTTSSFAFGAHPAQPTTPPNKADEGMSMEESPTRMEINGTGQSKPAGEMTFGLGPTPLNPFGQSGGSSSTNMFGFGAPSAASTNAPNPFGTKDENKAPASAPGGGFNFNRTASAPAISTAFSFGQKSEGSTPPATAFAVPSNTFSQLSSSSGGGGAAPFAFGQQQAAPIAHPFGMPTHQPAPVASSTPSSPFTSAPSFAFGVPSSSPFAFGSSQPSSPASAAAGLPHTPTNAGAASSPTFTFGQPSGSSGSTLFNIGAPPPSSGPGGTPGRPLKKLPRRAPAKR